MNALLEYKVGKTNEILFLIKPIKIIINKVFLPINHLSFQRLYSSLILFLLPARVDASQEFFNNMSHCRYIDWY